MVVNKISAPHLYLGSMYYRIHNIIVLISTCKYILFYTMVHNDKVLYITIMLENVSNGVSLHSIDVSLHSIGYVSHVGLLKAEI